MKRCSKCGEYKSDDVFSWRNKSLGVRQGLCKSCRNSYEKSWYASNSHRKDSIAEHNRLMYKRNSEYVCAYLMEHPCSDCGESDVVVLEFDHVRGRKIEAVSRMIRGSSLDRIRDEIAKCDVVCANCHRKRTSKMFWGLHAPKLVNS